MIEKLRGCSALAGVLALAAGWCAPAAAAPPDANLFTTYTVGTNLESADWIVCGSTQEAEGCFASGSLGPFGHIGAMLEDAPAVSGETVTRHIYVLDVATGTSKNGVTLFVYTKKDLVSASSDTVTVTLSHTVSLSPLVGGSTVAGSMAANGQYLFAGTNQSFQAVSIKKSTWAVAAVGGFTPPIPVNSVTANSRGYITVTFGAPGGQFSGFYVFGPTGGLEEDGGGGAFMLDTMNGVTPAPLP